MDLVFSIVGFLIYAALAGIALWGAYCCVVVWRRVAEKRFTSEVLQLEFLEVEVVLVSIVLQILAMNYQLSLKFVNVL